MSTDYVALHQHLEERLTQFGREMPGPTLAPRLRAAQVQVCRVFPDCIRKLWRTAH